MMMAIMLKWRFKLEKKYTENWIKIDCIGSPNCVLKSVIFIKLSFNVTHQQTKWSISCLQNTVREYSLYYKQVWINLSILSCNVFNTLLLIMYDDRNQHLSILITFHLFISSKEKKIFEKYIFSIRKDKTRWNILLFIMVILFFCRERSLYLE